MKIRSLLAPLAARAHGGDLDTEVHAVVRDSRQVRAGTVFVAIRGAQVDGHAWISALPPGSVAVVDHPVDVPSEVAWIQVDDTRAALAVAAAEVAGRPADHLRLVGVTGTNGKTTVTTVLQQALEAMGEVCGRVGTTGLRIAGVDLPAALTTPEAPELQAAMAQLVSAGGDVLAMEASSIGLVQHRLDGLRFHVGVFTNLQRDHLDHHGTMEAYAAAKATLFQQHLRAPGGLPRALLWGDDGTWRQMHPPSDHWRYGLAANADVRVEDVQVSDAGTRATVRTPVGSVVVQSPLVGDFQALNLGAVVGAGALLGVNLDALREALTTATGAPGRMERVAGPPGTSGPVALVDYAHTPDALAAALAAARAACRGRLWVVMGCGGDRDAGKRPLMGRAALAADEVIVTSDNPRSEDPARIAEQVVADIPAGRARVELDRRAAIFAALSEAGPEDVVLIAGKGHETTQEIGGVRTPFDDRQVAREALEAR